MKLKNENLFHPYPLAYYAIPLIIIIFSGFFDSIYLIYSHYHNYTDITYKSFCAVSKAINCDTVSQSQYSIFLNIPVSVWGLAGYIFYFILLLFAIHLKNKLWALLSFTGLIFTLYSIYLAWVSAFIIHSYCIMCIAGYGINMLLGYYPWLIFKRFCKLEYFKALKKDVALILQITLLKKITILFCISIFFIFLFFPKYWLDSFPEINESVSTGLTMDYSPWIGAKDDPELIIHEYSDYLCFQCKKMHKYLRTLINAYPEKIRLIHHNYPMDHEFNPVVVDKPFHIGAGNLALFSIYASSKENFWEINDKLYNLSQSNSMVTLKSIGETIGLDSHLLASALKNKSFREKLTYDIRKGMKLRITGTPSYIINGKLYEGTIPPEIIRDILKK